ncbi:MAG: serine/threonine protein kinase [Symbiobacteriia bacterium]
MIERRPPVPDFHLKQGAQVTSPTGTYEVLGLLGAGGSARVYLAQRRGWDDRAGGSRLCALKVAASETEAERLVAEGSLLASLQHPGIPQPFELFDWQTVTCLATEHRSGRTLERLQQEARGGPLPPAEVLTWAVRACGILAFLHSQPAPVVHRDVKPANLLLTDDGDIMLLDFGASRLYDPRKPGDTVPLGSPEFAAPEQLQGGGQTGPQADLWGLGATCFRLLTGSGPDRLFTFPPLRDLLPDAPAALAAALDGALQYDAALRFRDAREMQAALEQALVALSEAGSPGSARAPGSAGVLRRDPRLVTQEQTAAAATAAASVATAAASVPRAVGSDRLVLLMSALSPLVSALIVAITIYLATAARSPVDLTRQALPAPAGAGPAGVVETGLSTLVVTTEPAGAAVELDGEPLQNRTPLRLSRVTAGSHRLRLALSGYNPEERTLDVAAGGANELTVRLTPLLQLSLVYLAADGDGAWLEMPAGPAPADTTERLAVRLSPSVSPGATSPGRGPATLQILLRPSGGTPRTLYSGAYEWGQIRPLWAGRLSPGAYTVEATIVGADLPPLTAAASFQVQE